MKLKRSYEKVEEIPVAYRDLFFEVEGKWIRDDAEIEGIVPGDKFAEIREFNRSLNQQLVDAKKELEKFKDIDPAEYTKLKASAAMNGTPVAQLETRVADLTTKLEHTQQQYKNELAVIMAERDKKAGELDRYVINNELTAAGLAAGISERALDDLLLRGERIFRRIEGKTIAMQGETPLYSEKHPAQPLTPELWITEQLTTKAPHLFKMSAGGGANGGAGSLGQRTIDKSDIVAFGQHLEEIASGKIVTR